MLDVVAAGLGIKLPDFRNAAFDFLNRLAIALGCEFLTSLRAHLDEQKLRTELLQGPGEFLGFSVARHEIKYREVADRVLYHTRVILKLQQTDVTMMKLQCLQLKLGAILRLQCEAVIAAPLRHVLLEPRLVIFEE